MTDSPEIRVAVLEAQVLGLREQQKAHAEKTDEKIEKLSRKVEEKTEKLSAKMDVVLEHLNKGRGAFAMALFASGAIGAYLAKIIEIFPGQK